jgi:hypothetical protein
VKSNFLLLIILCQDECSRDMFYLQGIVKLMKDDWMKKIVPQDDRTKINMSREKVMNRL